MKVQAYRETDRFGGLTVAELSTIQVDLWRVHREPMSSLATLRWPGASAAFHDRAPSASAFSTDTSDTFTYRSEKGRRTVTGRLVYESVSDLIEFLLKRLSPSSDGELGRLMRRIRDRRGTRVRTDLEDLILGDESPSRGYGRRWRRRTREQRTLPITPRNDFEQLLDHRAQVGGRVYRIPRPFGSTGDGALYTAETTAEVSGRTIPRYDYLLPNMRATSYGGNSDSALLHFDGRRVEWLRDVRNLQPGIREAFEATGAVWRSADFDAFPLMHLRARCLVRVPGRRGLRKVVPAANLPDRLRTPAFALDSRLPIPLEGDELVIDNPAVALALLHRVTRGIFVPDDPAREVPARLLPEEESYLVLAEPAA